MPAKTPLHGDWGRGLRQRRENKGLSTRALAALAEISHSAVMQMEAGEFEPTSDLKMRLARIYEVEVADLFPYPPIRREAAS